MMSHDIEEQEADAALFAQLRHLWEEVDPLPADLVDRMVAVVAVEDLTREYEVLTLVEAAEFSAVRSESDTLTLQFSDGSTNVLVHVTATASDERRVDGWVDATPLAVRLAQGDREWSADPGESGRFAFDAVTPGVSRIRFVIKDDDGVREFMTPQFEV